MSGVSVGTKFTLTNTATGETWDGTADEFGDVSFRGLPYGTYELTETEAPTGYVRDENVKTIKIAAGETTKWSLSPAV